MNNDPYSYLSKTGLVSAGVSKSKDAAARVTVREHSRGRPSTKSGAGALGSQTTNSGTPATANIEGNESPAYEKMEKKSLKSLKGGGTEKELREGHNTKKWIAGAIKKPGALHAQLGVPQGEKIPVKKLATAASAGGKLGKRARLAQTLAGFKKK